MYDRFQETQQRDLADGGIDRVLESKKTTVIKQGRSKRFVILPYKAFEKMEADAEELRRVREIEAALDDPSPSIPASAVHREAKVRLQRALRKGRQARRP